MKFYEDIRKPKFHFEWGKDKKGEMRKYCTDILCFDIETTNFFVDDNGKPVLYEKGKSNEFWNSHTPCGIPYLWQFSINDRVICGQDLREFLEVLDWIPREISTIIYVHNLSFEFQFLCNILTWDKVFARSSHKPMYAVPKEYPHIQFRCSYMLTNLSLDSWGKKIGVEKLTGTVDYNKLRTPKTFDIGFNMLKYAEQDCLVMYHGLKKYVDEYGHIYKIPLTATGCIRQKVRKALQNEQYNMWVKTLIPSSSKEYKDLMRCFAGGYTHANRLHVGKVRRGEIHHYDFTSSYPYVMVSEKFPMSPWTKVKSSEAFTEPNDYAYYACIQLMNCTSIKFNTYIQASKLIDPTGMIQDNGRIVSVESAMMYVTEQDYDIIRKSYKGTFDVIECYRSKKEYLPRPLVEYILTLYNNKTTLKGVKGQEDLYLRSKEEVNSLYGMMVTAILQSDVVFDQESGKWSLSELTAEMVDDELAKLRKLANDKYFLSYSWGVWVTAYARHNLWENILEYDIETLYADTDSMFTTCKCNFQRYNTNVNLKLIRMCNALDLPYSMCAPTSPKGQIALLGEFMEEDILSEFVTLGAKRYCMREKESGKLSITVAGINKGAVDCLDDDIENFKDGFNFNKDHESVKKLLMTYNNDQPQVMFDDGFKNEFRYGCNLRPVGYLLEVADEYKQMWKFFDGDYFNTEENELALRSYFKG